MGNKEDDDDDDDDGNDDDKFDGFSGDPERLKAFNVSIYFVFYHLFMSSVGARRER